VALLSLEEELDRARDQVPFSNGFEFESWSSIWCDECAHYENCPLLLVILREQTPAAWEDRNPGALNRYVCEEFTQSETEETTVEALPGAR
jgi:hypothetical protein